jgi:hypothetical protein
MNGRRLPQASGIGRAFLLYAIFIWACGIGGLNAEAGRPLAVIRGRINLPIVVESHPSISGTT